MPTLGRPIHAGQMLRTASRLAGEDAGPGRPAACDLRRASSTAYYALFHRITRDGALAAVWSADEDDITEVARWFSHTGIRAAAVLVVTAAGSGQPPRPDRSAVNVLRTATGRPVPAALRRLAEAFVELHDTRVVADYSNSYEPRKYDTLGHVTTAREAIDSAAALWQGYWSDEPARQNDHDSYCRFLQVALLKSGGPKTR